ncbi:MAG: phosphatidylglycerophosphate synthase [Patiriisocius sp.]|jgi:phosphatidylglycerophosphate synthase
MNQRLMIGIADQWGVANSMTAFRCLAPLPIMVLVFFGQYQHAAYFAFFAALTDFEGQYARLTGTPTELGRVFDPLADKIFTDILLIVLTFATFNVGILVLALLAIMYDIDNTSRRITEILAACENKARIRDDTPATMVSKWKTGVLFTVVIGALAAEHWEGLLVWVDPLVFVGIVLVAVSWGNNRKKTIGSFFANRSF